MQRPTSVTVFGILNLVFGGLGVLCTPMSMMFLFLLTTPENPISHAMNMNVGYRVYLIWVAVVGVLAAFVLVAAGIGLLQMKSWARLVSIGYAIFSIVMGILGMIVSNIFVFGPAIADARARGPAAAAGMVGLAMGVAGGVLGMIYPVALLIFMTRPRIRNAFQCQDVPPII